MLKVIHRINTIRELEKIPKEYGVEIDLRNEGTNIVLNHDPFEKGESFEEYCRNYDHALMLLNVKTEGIEEDVLRIVKENNVKNYFFLDLTFPSIIKLISQGENNIAIRFSEYEPIENALALKGKIKWVWIDTFTKLPITKEIFNKIKESGFKTFLVSPDRWGREDDIEKYSQYIKENNIDIDAVMSSLELIERWK